MTSVQRNWFGSAHFLASQSHVDGATIAAGSPYGCGVQPDEVGEATGQLMTCLDVRAPRIGSVVIHISGNIPYLTVGITWYNTLTNWGAPHSGAPQSGRSIFSTNHPDWGSQFWRMPTWIGFQKKWACLQSNALNIEASKRIDKINRMK